MERLYKNRLWLVEHYITQEESMLAIAKEAGCGGTTICRWLHKLGISICDRGYLWRDQDWLYKHYIVREESLSIMAKGAQCDLSTILNWLRKNNISVRSVSEGTFLATRNSVIITPDLLEFMGGELVGDGHVGMTSKRSANYQHGSKYKEYIIWLSGCLNAWGIKQSGQIHRHKDRQHGAITYRYESRSYPELVPIRKRWYPNGKKIVPEDLRLTPIMARQWYIGDGSLIHPKRGRSHITLATCGFDRQSIEHLIGELSRLGFKATRRPSGNTIGISVYSTQDFLEWIGPCPIACYDYKWAI